MSHSRSRKFQSTFIHGETPRERYANAYQKKTDLPVPLEIISDPSGTLSDRYQEARIAVDRFWAALGNEILVKFPVPKRACVYKRENGQ